MEHFPDLTPDQIERTTARLHRVARAWVDDAGARDLAQMAWLKVSAGEFSGVRKLESFLIGVVRNLARKEARGHSRRAHREEQVARPEGIPSAAELAERNELAARLAKAIGELPEPQRTAVLLRYDQGLTAAEIARTLDVGPGTIRTRLSRARKTLRDKLQDSTDPQINWALILPAWAPKPTVSSAIGVVF
ncbi:MAG: RNA polymerase sigma factor, partial [Planctomycetota bacterium]|nr:RNA polymerase sigma factor [Planctomycetota bacterium]